MNTFTFKTPRGFALKAASDFYTGFTPGSGMAVVDAEDLTLAFRLDGTFEAVAVALAEVDGQIVARFTGTKDEAAVRKQVARMLGLDVDAEAWRQVGKRDPVVGQLQAEFPGFFTAAKPSPYDAAAWGIISPRINMKQAAKLKMGLAAAHGDAVKLDGKTHHVFPSPKQLLKVASFAGLSEEKLARLKGIAIAALEGKLDPDRLRAMDEGEALEELQKLNGVGPWTATNEELVKLSSTPLGTYRSVWKTRAAAMSPEKGEPEKFWIADVPWTQYFRAPFAIHTAYWHEDFGMPKSAGCINVSPEDGKHLFGWTDPPVPPSWQGAGSSKEGGLGTVLVVLP